MLDVAAYTIICFFIFYRLIFETEECMYIANVDHTCDKLFCNNKYSIISLI